MHPFRFAVVFSYPRTIAVARVGVGAVLVEVAHHRRVARDRGTVDRRLAEAVPVRRTGTRCEQPPNDAKAASSDRERQRRVALSSRPPPSLHRVNTLLPVRGLCFAWRARLPGGP